MQTNLGLLSLLQRLSVCVLNRVVIIVVRLRRRIMAITEIDCLLLWKSIAGTEWLTLDHHLLIASGSHLEFFKLRHRHSTSVCELIRFSHFVYF